METDLRGGEMSDRAPSSDDQGVEGDLVASVQKQQEHRNVES